MQENLSPEEIQAQQKREEELNKSMLNILQELCTAQKNLALAKGAQAKKEAQKTVNDITNQIGEFVKNASNGYTDRKGKINDIKKEYEKKLYDIAWSRIRSSTIPDLVKLAMLMANSLSMLSERGRLSEKSNIPLRRCEFSDNLADDFVILNRRNALIIK